MITKTSKYAVTALLFLARTQEERFFSIQELSKVTKIPQPYLAKIMKNLASYGMVLSKKGVKGGVRLPKDKVLTLLDVCKALEDPVITQSCFLNDRACSTTSACPVHSKWADIRGRFSSFLSDYKITG